MGRSTSVSVAHEVDLKPYHTFGVEAKAEAFVSVSSVAEVLAAVDAYGGMPGLILGGGSNILPLGYVPGLTLHNQFGGIEVAAEQADWAWWSVGGGVVWHELVMASLSAGLGGLENLALIPGSAGAAPIQNIGAYGVELKDVFSRLEALDLITGETVVFEAADCQFGYRDSYFKKEGKGRYFITRVVIKLSVKDHLIRTEYGAIRDELQRGYSQSYPQPRPQDIARAVISIRSSKLPDWRVLGNAGSFFKNPVVPIEAAGRIREGYPQAPVYPQSDGTAKLAAGWLIDQCGWRGQRRGHAGCYEKQALVLVNHGGATGAEILALGDAVAASVYERFGVALEREVNVVGQLA